MRPATVLPSGLLRKPLPSLAYSTAQPVVQFLAPFVQFRPPRARCVREGRGTSHALRGYDLISVRLASMEEHLVSKLPLPESFEAQYLEYNGILPLEIAGDQLRVAVVGEPA